jgi:hypothetical protein
LAVGTDPTEKFFTSIRVKLSNVPEFSVSVSNNQLKFYLNSNGRGARPVGAGAPSRITHYAGTCHVLTRAA